MLTSSKNTHLQSWQTRKSRS